MGGGSMGPSSCPGGLVKCRMPGVPVFECIPAEVCDTEGGEREDGSSSSDN